MTDHKPSEATLAALRRDIDAIDHDLQHLLRRRFAIAAAIRDSKGDCGEGTSLSAGREALVLESLAIEGESSAIYAPIAGLWRQIVSQMNRLQGDFTLHLLTPSEQREALLYLDIARAYYGFTTPMIFHRTVRALLRTLGSQPASIGVVPLIDNAASGSQWWLYFLATARDEAIPLQVLEIIPMVAGLPHLRSPIPQLAVLGRAPLVPSGRDRILVIVEVRAGFTPSRLIKLLADCGMTARWHDYAPSERDRDSRLNLIDIDGFDITAAALMKLLRRGLKWEDRDDPTCIVIGRYTVPLDGSSGRGEAVMSRTMIAAPQPQPGLVNITPYKPGATPTNRDDHKLSANENPLGSGLPAQTAMTLMAGQIASYPDPSAARLRQALAAHYDLEAERILCGSGSSEILALLGQAYLGVGDEAVMTRHSFEGYRILTRAAGAVPIFVAESNYVADLEAMLAAVTSRTRMVFIANPSNPTGTMVDRDTISAFHRKLRRDIVLVLDGAYAEYVTEPSYECGFALARAAGAENVVVMRTFSKIHGLAGLRIGWGYGPAAIIDNLHRIRGAFNTAAPAQAAALAALEDTEHVANSCAFNAHWRARLSEALTAFGLTVVPSVANFILVIFPDTPNRTAFDADAALRSRGLLVRRLESYDLPAGLRITIGTAEANEAIIATLQDFMGTAERAS